MILNSLKDSASIESLHPLFKKAFDYIKATDFSKVPAGKSFWTRQTVHLGSRAHR